MLVTLEQSSAKDVGLGASGSSSFGLLLLELRLDVTRRNTNFVIASKERIFLERCAVHQLFFVTLRGGYACAHLKFNGTIHAVHVATSANKFEEHFFDII